MLPQCDLVVLEAVPGDPKDSKCKKTKWCAALGGVEYAAAAIVRDSGVVFPGIIHQQSTTLRQVVIECKLMSKESTSHLASRGL